MPRSTRSVKRPAPGTILVAGANGFLGQEIVRVFSAEGWEVRGLVRDSAKTDRVRLAGGSPVLGDVLDVDSLRRAASDCDAIIHVAANPSAEPGGADLSRGVRVQGTLNLVDAAKSGHVPRLVVGSGYWVYAGQPGRITEDSPVDPQGESRINYDAERAGLEANLPGELEVMVVRPGMVYGDGAWFRPIVEAIRAGTYAVIDGGRNHWSFVSLPDTGAGFVSVVQAGRAGEAYNVVDRHSSPWGEFVTYVAKRLGLPPPPSISFEEAEKAYGTVISKQLVANRSTSAAKLEAIGWRPTYPTFRGGINVLLPADPDL